MLVHTAASMHGPIMQCAVPGRRIGITIRTSLNVRVYGLRIRTQARQPYTYMHSIVLPAAMSAVSRSDECVCELS